ncbi:unnamed protein product [Caenorhabditis brenneri]
MAPRSASQNIGSSETFVKKVNSKSVKSPKLPKVNILDFIKDTIESGDNSEVITWVDQNKSGFKVLDGKALVEIYNKVTGKRYTKFDNFCRPLRRLAEEGVLFKPKTMRSTWYFVETVMAAALADVAMTSIEEETKEEVKEEELMETDDNSELQLGISTCYFARELLETARAGVAEMEEATKEVKEEDKQKELMKADEIPEHPISLLEMLLMNCKKQLHSIPHSSDSCFTSEYHSFSVFLHSSSVPIEVLISFIA